MPANCILEKELTAAVPSGKRARLQIHLSSLLVTVLTAGVLLGINVRPYHFYYPRLSWIDELNQFEISHKSEPGTIGLYGWPTPAYPCWNFCGNNFPIGESFPQFSHFTSDAGELHIACYWVGWNHRALWIDIGINVAMLIAAGVGWELCMRRRSY